MTSFVLLWTLVAFVFQNTCESARILAIFPTPSISHQVVFRKLTVELSKRGHELVIFTTDPLNDPRLKNYTEIDQSKSYEIMRKLTAEETDFWSLWKNVGPAMTDIAEMILSSPEMQRIVKNPEEERFDLILMEYLSYFSLFGIGRVLKVPIVGMMSLSMSPRLHYLSGNPPGFAYSPASTDEANDELDLWGRVYIAYRNIRFQLIEYTDFHPPQDALVKKYLGDDMPSSDQLIGDVDLIMIDEYVALGYPRPTLPNIVRIGGIALDTTFKGFDAGLKRFLDEAVDGFVYFSLGSNVLSKTLRPEKIEALVKAFAELPYRVLWKWELDTLPGKPDNVYISKWLPQYDVLAHPNIKVFFYQGGLQSTQEAISNAVPLIGCPVWFDQGFIVRKIESAGLGKRLSFDDLYDSDKIRDAIIEVTTDERYEKNMLKFRDLVFDEPETPLERAVWWTEYVIRNNGTPHLKTRVRHMSWYQREFLDVILLALILISLVCFAVYKLIISPVKHLLSFNFNTTKEKIK